MNTLANVDSFNTRHLRSSLICLLAAAALVSSAGAATIRGRAYGAYVDAPAMGISQQYFCDTGMLPVEGGAITEAAALIEVPSVLSLTQVTASSHGNDNHDCRGDSDAHLGGSVILPGHPAVVTFSGMHGHDDDDCCDSDGDDPDLVVIDDLTFGGVPVAVTGQFNQRVTIDGVGTLIINELSWSDDDDCDDDDFVVNGLRLELPGGEQFVVASSFLEADDECCTVAGENTSWGAIKAMFSAGR